MHILLLHHLLHLFTFVTEQISYSLRHSEAKLIEILGLGAEKGLLQGQARRMGDSCSKTLNSLIFQEEVFIGKIWDERGRVCDSLLIDWW